MSIYDGLEQRRADIERHQENSARLAQAFARFEARGAGYVEFGDMVDFGLTFIEKPFVTIGSAIDLDALASDLNLDEEGDVPPIPLISGVVTEWERDERGFYTGAWVGAAVYFQPDVIIDEDVRTVIEVHYTFTAIAMKDIPIDVRN